MTGFELPDTGGEVSSVTTFSFESNFDHSLIEGIEFGPRREVKLVISPLVWDGSNDRHAESIQVRFGGIENFDEMVALFNAIPPEKSELAWMRFSDNLLSKPGRLFIELAFERIDAHFLVRCSSMQVRNFPKNVHP